MRAWAAGLSQSAGPARVATILPCGPMIRLVGKPASLKADIEAKTDDLKEVLESDDIDAIRESSDVLAQVIQQMGASMYEQGTPDDADFGDYDDDAPEGDDLFHE